MDKKIFHVYLAKEGVPNDESYAKLDLPASPWELWDALDKVRLQTDDILYMEIEDYAVLYRKGGVSGAVPLGETPEPHRAERLSDGKIRYFLGAGYNAPLHHGERYSDGRIPTEPSGGNKPLKLKQQRDGITIPLLLLYRISAQRRKGESP